MATIRRINRPRPVGVSWASVALFRYSPDRKGEHPRHHLHEFTGIQQADGYVGFHHLYEADRTREAACWAHVRRKFFDFLQANGSPIAREAIERIGALYAIEKGIYGQPPDARRSIRRARAGPLLDDLKTWLHESLLKLSAKSELAAAIRYATSRCRRSPATATTVR